MKTYLLVGAGIGLCAMAWAAKDPVIMTVNGVDVPKSEFEYLYHKNSQQQLTSQPLDEYVDMFVKYRLRVADAVASGIDTTASFRQEMEQYRHDLAAPYLVDSVYLNKLVEEAWDRSKEEVETSHIMIFKQPVSSQNEYNKHVLDSLRNCIVSGNEDFAEIARQHSMDRTSAPRGGSLGYITQGRYPYRFEVAAYSLKPGEVSESVESPMAYHLIKSTARRPARGTVRAAHILLMDRKGNAPEASAEVKARIDSIYNLLQQDPSRFEELAKAYSEDPGSATQGGMLPWFGAGQMVEPFEEAAFSTPKGQISAPFKSDYGWHIIYKIDEKGVPALEEMKAKELSRISNPQDYRYLLVKRNQNEQLSKKHKAVVNNSTLDAIKSKVMINGLDSAFYLPDVTLESQELLKIGKNSYYAGEFIASLGGSIQPDKGNAIEFVDGNFEGFLNRKLIAAEEDWLEANNSEYRNLYNEYWNGSLLYEASVRNVWDKAAKDTEGLEAFFRAHKSDYSWKEPRAKGYLVQAVNDSVMSEIQKRYAELPKAEALSTLRKEFKGEATFDRILLAKGANPMVDNLLFGGPEASPFNSKYTVYMMLDGRVIDSPEEMSDVKGQVTSDYQEALEEEWIAGLREKYPVVINQKVVKKVK